MPAHGYILRPYVVILKLIYLAAPVLVAAYGIFSCGIWDLVPWPGIEPRPPALGRGVLATGPPGKSQGLMSF